MEEGDKSFISETIEPTLESVSGSLAFFKSGQRFCQPPHSRISTFDCLVTMCELFPGFHKAFSGRIRTAFSTKKSFLWIISNPVTSNVDFQSNKVAE
jgi:hypothetical protein